jgi:hypothetical protein
LCISGSPPAIETIGRAGLLDRGDRLLDRHALLQHVVRLLDLAAAGAFEVAGEQRLELDQQRELLHPLIFCLARYAPSRIDWRSGMLTGSRPLPAG